MTDDKTPQSVAEAQCFLGRQPIFNAKLDVVAYELLFRTEKGGPTGGIDGDSMTYNVILNTFTEIGIDNVVGESKAFLNFTRNLLLNPPPIPKERVVIEVLEDIAADEEVIAAVKSLLARGYTVALDDFVFKEELIPLLEIVKLVKVDIFKQGPDWIRNQVKLLEPYHCDLLAEKVETHEEFELCKELGFKYFQGYFLSKPKVITGKKSATNKLITMRLLAELRNPNMTAQSIADILMQDPKMSYKVLRIINSAAYAMPQKIESLQQAVVLIGLETLKEWASMIALSSTDCKSPELLLTALTRAKMCELVAKKHGVAKADSYFFVGLVSLLDAVMDEPFLFLMTNMPLTEELTSALLEHEGPVGQVLENVIAYEKGDFYKIEDGRINSEGFRGIYLESIRWAKEMFSSLH